MVVQANVLPCITSATPPLPDSFERKEKFRQRQKNETQLPEAQGEKKNSRYDVNCVYRSGELPALPNKLCEKIAAKSLSQVFHHGSGRRLVAGCFGLYFDNDHPMAPHYLNKSALWHCPTSFLVVTCTDNYCIWRGVILQYGSNLHWKWIPRHPSIEEYGL